MGGNNDDGEDFPVAVGVIYHNPKPNYVDDLIIQREQLRQGKDKGSINDLLRSGHTWEVA
jgi:hypothetical protein